MNKKRVYTLLIILGVLVLAVLFYVSIPYIANAATRPVKSFNKEITAISCESEDIPYVEAYGNIYKGKKVISLFDLCEKKHKTYYDTLCIYDNRAYFICSESDKTNKQWCISSVDLKTHIVQTHFVFENPAVAYDDFMNLAEYSKRNGYYFDGKIVLNDYASVWEYDLKSGSVKEYGYDDFEFPVQEIYGEYVGDNAIKIHTPQWEKTFSFYDISQESTGVSTVYSFKDRKIRVTGCNFINDFFVDNAIQYINGKIYAFGECTDDLGGAYAVLLEYDLQQNKWLYVTSIYTYSPASEAYIIPSAS